MELFTAATTVLTAIKAANAAYATVKQAGSNFGEAWTAASKFIDNKATVDAYAEVDEKNNDLSTDAFINSILFKRFEKEVDQIMLAFLKGEELKQWAQHKEAVKEKALQDARDTIERERQAKRRAAIKRMRREENVNYAIIGITIAGVIAAGGAVLLLITGVV
jgi:Xaa-Pro aminopeptidase